MGVKGTGKGKGKGKGKSKGRGKWVDANESRDFCF